MLLDKKPFIWIWRPFYRLVFGGILWPFLGRMKIFFLAESEAQFQRLTAQFLSLEQTLESRQRSQWAAFEQLYLCLLSDPDRIARSQVEQLLEAQRRNQAIVERLMSTEIQGRALLDTVMGLDRNSRALTIRLQALEAETYRRWECLEQLLTAFLGDPDHWRPADVERASGQCTKASAGVRAVQS